MEHLTKGRRAFVATKEKNRYTFFVGEGKNLKQDFETEIKDFSGDFQINLYACWDVPNKAVYDYILVEDEAPEDVSPGDLVTTTWANIKAQ